jgi:hypothetical protein
MKTLTKQEETMTNEKAFGLSVIIRRRTLKRGVSQSHPVLFTNCLWARQKCQRNVVNLGADHSLSIEYTTTFHRLSCSWFIFHLSCITPNAQSVRVEGLPN